MKIQQLSQTSIIHFLFALLLLTAGLPTIAYGGLYWEMEVKTEGVPQGIPQNLPKPMRDQMMAQFKPKTEISKNYFSSHAFRTEKENSILILNYDTMTMYHLFPDKKMYTKVDMASMMQGEHGQMTQQMMGDVTVTPTEEVQEIAGYKCRKYQVTMMGSTGEQWVSNDVKGYAEFKAMAEKMETLYQKNPSLKHMNIAGMMSQLDGFPVKTVMTVMGLTTTSTLKSIEEKSLSKALFEVPSDYQLMEMKMPPSMKKPSPE